MAGPHLVGIDFGSESARGVLVEVESGRQLGHAVHAYRHGIVSGQLAGRPLPPGFVLQVAPDYLEAAEAILAALGRGRNISGIGIDFTASSPMPALADGTPLSALFPGEPHAYVKLWKHSAQAQADALNAQGGAYLADFGGRLSGEWMLAKAAQLREEAPALWARTERFIEAGDWLVRQLTGEEARSLDFAAYKAQYRPGRGYPLDVVPGLAERQTPPVAVGTPAGRLTEDWRRLTGVEGEAVVAVAAIDSHVVLPAVGAVEPGVFVGALGTSAGFLALDGAGRGLPPGLEGAAHGAVLPGLWCYEAGQAAFGDTLSWYVRAFPRDADLSLNFAAHNAAARRLEPGESGLLALDWLAGNRVPLADSILSGLILGLDRGSTSAGIYRALLESLCFGTRSIADAVLAGGVPIDRVVMTSGLTVSNPFLVEVMADVFGRPIEVPEVENPTALGAAIHGAVACGAVPDFAAGAARFGARTCRRFEPDARRARRYEALYAQYRALAGNAELRRAMHALAAIARGA